MFKKTLMASVVALAIASPAHAVVQVSNFDWTTPFGTYNDISNIVMGGLGLATVKQEVDGAGNVFVGAKFTEFGAAFSSAYVDKTFLNQNFGTNSIYFDFIGMSGTVTSIGAGGAFDYMFDPAGAIIVSYGATKASALPWFTTPVLGIGGSAFNNIGLNVKGTSEILALAVPSAATVGGMSFKDENDVSLDWFQNINGLFFDVVTTNTFKTLGASYDCDGTGPSTKQCRDIGVQSTGDITLYRVPEPASLALVGLGLLGAGLVRRRQKLVK